MIGGELIECGFDGVAKAAGQPIVDQFDQPPLP